MTPSSRQILISASLTINEFTISVTSILRLFEFAVTNKSLSCLHKNKLTMKNYKIANNHSNLKANILLILLLHSEFLNSLSIMMCN